MARETTLIHPPICNKQVTNIPISMFCSFFVSKNNSCSLPASEIANVGVDNWGVSIFFITKSNKYVVSLYLNRYQLISC